jgi:EAL domain-containing protein (putative c-di-GMP-specific phosphodiesterase class I)
VNRVTEPGGHSIVRAICALAHALGHAVTGEGIETREQKDALRDLGCEFGQGYLFSRPLPAEEMTRFLAFAQPGAAAAHDMS